MLEIKQKKFCVLAVLGNIVVEEASLCKSGKRYT